MPAPLSNLSQLDTGEKRDSDAKAGLQREHALKMSGWAALVSRIAGANALLLEEVVAAGARDYIAGIANSEAQALKARGKALVTSPSPATVSGTPRKTGSNKI